MLASKDNPTPVSSFKASLKYFISLLMRSIQVSQSFCAKPEGNFLFPYLREQNLKHFIFLITAFSAILSVLGAQGNCRVCVCTP